MYLDHSDNINRARLIVLGDSLRSKETTFLIDFVTRSRSGYQMLVLPRRNTSEIRLHAQVGNLRL
jgi:hypothetical protein